MTNTVCLNGHELDASHAFCPQCGAQSTRPALADWYPDPRNADQWRYWDGTRWTDQTGLVEAVRAPASSGQVPTADSAGPSITSQHGEPPLQSKRKHFKSNTRPKQPLTDNLSAVFDEARNEARDKRTRNLIIAVSVFIVVVFVIVAGAIAGSDGTPSAAVEPARNIDWDAIVNTQCPSKVGPTDDHFEAHTDGIVAERLSNEYDRYRTTCILGKIGTSLALTQAIITSEPDDTHEVTEDGITYRWQCYANQGQFGLFQMVDLTIWEV